MHKKNMEIPDKKGIIEIGGRVGIPRKTSFDLIIEEEGVKRRTGFFNLTHMSFCISTRLETEASVWRFSGHSFWDWAS